MHPYLLSSLHSAAYGNLFEAMEVVANEEDVVVFRSTRHPNEVGACDSGDALFFVSTLNNGGLKAAFPDLAAMDGLVLRHKKNDLSDDLRRLGRMFKVAATLPPDAGVAAPQLTDAERLVRTRIGQHRYKIEQLAAWGGACAVTGIAEPALLRASHAKPWADASDAERIDPANGLPLAVHLDALFDAGLITFGDDGHGVVSPRVPADVRALYGIDGGFALRLPLSPKQKQYVSYHRDHVFRST